MLFRSRDRENPFAWYQLGVIYSQKGDTARAALATAEQAQMTGQNAMALRSATTAMAGLTEGSSDYLRAQDIALVARAAVEQERKRK